MHLTLLERVKKKLFLRKLRMNRYKLGKSGERAEHPMQKEQHRTFEARDHKGRRRNMRLQSWVRLCSLPGHAHDLIPRAQEAIKVFS